MLLLPSLLCYREQLPALQSAGLQWGGNWRIIQWQIYTEAKVSFSSSKGTVSNNKRYYPIQNLLTLHSKSVSHGFHLHKLWEILPHHPWLLRPAFEWAADRHRLTPQHLPAGQCPRTDARNLTPTTGFGRQAWHWSTWYDECPKGPLEENCSLSTAHLYLEAKTERCSLPRQRCLSGGVSPQCTEGLCTPGCVDSACPRDASRI